MLTRIVYTPEKKRGVRAYYRLALNEARLVVGHGIEGDVKGSKGKRQLNVISEAAVHSLNLDGFRTEPGQLGEQLTVSGVDIEALPPGTQLRIGRAAVIELVELRTGCTRFDRYQQKSHLGAEGRLGMMARVRIGGSIAVGDAVEVVPK